MKRKIGFLGVAAFALGLTSCGKEFCVGPFGNCQNSKTVQSGDPVTTAFTVKVSASEVSPNVEFLVSASGGTAPYTFSVSEGTDVQKITEVTQDGATVATFKAMLGKQAVVITVTPTKGASKNVAVYVRG